MKYVHPNVVKRDAYLIIRPIETKEYAMFSTRKNPTENFQLVLTRFMHAAE